MKKVHVVPHTHWDREWYFTLEDSNSLLVEHMDYLVNYLESNLDFPHFVFDGQLSIVEEYIKYRPENKERLKALISSKRIFVGPWYTQCDTLNPKIESVIRNLQYGINISSEYGNHMSVGYLPDTFGQNAYLPSIFKNCELEYSIVQRGVKTSDANEGINFHWTSPNGDSIKTNYIFFGYGPGKFLETTREYMDTKLLPILDSLSEKSNDQEILLPSGGDQALIRGHFKDVTQELTNMNSKYEFTMSNYEQFMDKVNFSDVQTITGELYTPEKSRIHRTIHSQRADLKILNNKVEKSIIQRLEPLVAMSCELGVEVNTKLVDEIWKKLFDVHAHDSLGGCNSDRTNEKIICRLKSIEDSIDGQINIMKKKICRMIATDNDNIVVIFNFEAYKDKEISMKIYTKKQSFNLLKNGKDIPFMILNTAQISGGTKVEVTADGEKIINLPSYFETEITVNIESHSIGYQTFYIQEYDNEFKDCNKVISENRIETKFYTIEINDQVKISSKVVDEEFVLAFETQTDDGDSYDFSNIAYEVPIRYTQITNVAMSENDREYRVSFENQVITHSDEAINVTTMLTISKGTNDLKINHDILNNVKNHRLRALFIKSIIDVENFADSGFGVVFRENISSNIKSWKEKSFVEKPLAIYPFERFFGVDNFSLINSSVKEYEILDDAVALTLYRSVGVLGKDNLQTRPGRASGINNVVVKTTDANLIGTHLNIHYNVCLGKLFEEDGEILPYHIDKMIAHNYEYYQTQTLNLFHNRMDRFELPYVSTKLEETYNMFNVNTKGIYISSIRLNSKNEVEYRIYNPAKRNIEILLPSRFDRVNLLGQAKETIEHYQLEFDYITIIRSGGIL